MKNIRTQASFINFLFFAILLLNACRPIRNLKEPPAAYKGDNKFNWNIPLHDATKKNVFIIADNKGTELFDMMASFYLFSATEKANVYIIAKEKMPVLIKRDMFVLPHLTFAEADSMKIQADVIVIPALARRADDQDTLLISWIKAHFTDNTRMLSICDGAATAAATGLYDGKLITCHASDFAAIRSRFSNPIWVQNVNFTKSGNLFSTAGVSNAVEGSLTVINEIFGREIMQKVSDNIHYPHEEIQTAHRSIALGFNNKLSIARKVIFRKNKKIGILLENGINEFELASIFDTYDRSFPLSSETVSSNAFILNDTTIQTKYGLTLVCTANKNYKKLDELHVAMPRSFSKDDAEFFKSTKLIMYDNPQKLYPIDVCLKRISDQYGNKFENVVKVLLDYN
jgi:transcriptional regulator GlxA family with amidase domain